MTLPDLRWISHLCRKTVAALIVGVGSFESAHQAVANSCTTFENIIQQASKNFEAQPATPSIYDVTPDLCDIATASGGVRLYHCRWDYTYRATAAIELMRTINLEIEKCLGVQSRKIEDGVNHPDTYEQRLYRLGDINISLSLKDKAALNQSFVSLQVSGIKTN